LVSKNGRRELLIESLLFDPIVPIFFVYGLAFYTMGMAVALEAGVHAGIPEVQRAMWYLAIFGLIHGLHEWFEMFFIIAMTAFDVHASLGLEIVRVIVLVASFWPLCIFGLYLLRPSSTRIFRLGMIAVPVIFLVGTAAIVVVFGPDWDVVVHAVDSWGRYSLGMPGGALAGIGLLLQSRGYREEGERIVARSWLAAGVALAIYGVVGQSAASPSVIFPATIYNTQTFARLFGFPVQLLRASAATLAMIGLISALRALERLRQRMLQAANEARLEAQERAQEETARREALQTELLRRTVAAQEDERARVARELHDETGQTLTALNYSAAALKTTLQSGHPIPNEMIDRLVGLSVQALTDLRQLVADLRPAQLDDLGLVAAMHTLAGQVRKRLGVDIKVEVVGQRRRLPTDIETVLFRVAQEALTNVAKHAQVPVAGMRLVFADDSVTLDVFDQGVGFDVELMPSPIDGGGWGLAGMQERAASVGGEVHFTSAPNQGTTIRAVIPLQVEKTDEQAHSSSAR
jgi:signal transduction histidine kinase